MNQYQYQALTCLLTEYVLKEKHEGSNLSRTAGKPYIKAGRWCQLNQTFIVIIVS